MRTLNPTDAYIAGSGQGVKSDANLAMHGRSFYCRKNQPLKKHPLLTLENFIFMPKWPAQDPGTGSLPDRHFKLKK
jgi:hypothetical protein